MVIEIIRDIVIYGKGKSPFMAGHRKLPVELLIAWASIRGQAFKIQIEAVIAIELCVRHQPVYKVPSVRAQGKVVFGAEIRESGRIIEIIHHCPNLHAKGMGLLHILR